MTHKTKGGRSYTIRLLVILKQFTKSCILIVQFRMLK
jgi:hypothetical protein